MSVEENDSPKLIRAVTRWQVVGLSINDVIGSGVYLLPAAAALYLGTMSIAAVLLAGCAVALLVLCFAESSSYFDQPGGSYLYAREAFGEFVGFEVGWMSWVTRATSVASLSVGFAQATSYLWPAAGEFWGRTLLVVSLLILLTWINVIGVKQSATFAVFLSITKTIPLILFIAIGLFAIDKELLNAESPEFSFQNLSRASLLLLFAYVGFESSPTAAGEFKNPKRDMPFALLVMIILVTLIYTLVQVVAVGTLPNLGSSVTPLADSSALFIGGWAAVVMSIGAIISIGGNNNNSVLVGPRYLYALARDGFGPKAFGKVHPKFHTPYIAIVFQSLVSLALALSGSFVGLAMLSMVARLITYICTAASVPILRKRFADKNKGFKIPGGIAIPAGALLLCVVLVAGAKWENLAMGALALIVGAIIFRFKRKEH